MKIEEWKQTYQHQKPKKELLEKIMKEVDAVIVKQGKCFYFHIVSGKCMFDECNNTYKKSVPYLIKRGGPFCDFCMRYRRPLKDTQHLIKTHRPDIYNTIVECEIDKDLLTIGSSTMATFQCGKNCSRCEKPHRWSSTIRRRILPSKFGNCPFCSGNRNCACIQENEFRCYLCKKIKQNEERAGSTTRCKLCSRSMNDGDKIKMIRYVWQRTHSIMKRKKKKCGDLTEQHLHCKYDEQEGKCYISGIKLALGTFHDWQLSVERVIQEGGQYSNENTVLICREFQNAPRQFSREVWDEICALVLGIEDETNENIEMIDQLIQEEINTPQYELLLPPKPDHPTTKDGKRFCKYCNEWKTNEEMAYQNASLCKKCRKHRRDQTKSTFHGRIHYLYKTAQFSHVKRKLDFTITETDIENIYLRQHGRCFYSRIPLGFSGQYQMSLERVDPTKGYIHDNIALIILGLNVGDWTRVKHQEDERDGSSGWNRKKLLWAVKQNPRPILPKTSSVLEILEKLKMDRQKNIKI